MVLLTGGLLVAALLKIVAVLNAIRWLHVRGPAFKAVLAARRPRTLAEQERAYDEVSAGFFPFGVKDYRLRRMIRTTRGARRIVVGWPARAFQRLLFSFAALVALSAADMVYVASATHVPDIVPRRAHDAVALALAIALLIATIMIAIEAVYAYAILGSYGIGFHELRPERRGAERALVREYQVFAGTLIVVHLAGIGAMYLVGLRFGGFAKIAMVSGDPTVVPRQVLHCSYYAGMAFSGAGDPEPLGVAGQVVVGGITMQGLAFLLLVLASMLAIADRGGTPPSLPSASSPPAPPAPPPERETAAVVVPLEGARRPTTTAAGFLLLGAAAGAAAAWLALRRRRR